ncbi:MAG: TetR/AcrR family transcriptional regulator [Thermodesulfovibrionia bacterium]
MDKRETKEKILNATLNLISKKGYLGSTTREIAMEAGVTELTLFRHFGSKERLFGEVLKRYSFLPALKESIPKMEGLSYEDALMNIGMLFIKTLKEKKPIIKIMLSETNVYPDKVRKVHQVLMDRTIKTLSDFFKTLQKKGVLREFSPEIGTRAFLGMIFTYFKAEEIIKGRSLKKGEIEKTIREFVSIFTYGTLKRG